MGAKLSRTVKIAVPLCAVVLAVAICAVAWICIGGGSHQKQVATVSDVYQTRVDAGELTPTAAEAARAGELTAEQAELVSSLERNQDSYAPTSIVLQDTTVERAQEIADKLGATLRITKTGDYAQLTLPEGTTVLDVASNWEYSDYISEISADWYARTADAETDAAGADDSDAAAVADANADEDPIVTDRSELPILALNPSQIFYGEYADRQTNFQYINVRNKLNVGTHSSAAVAVIDTGIDTDHQSFGNSVISTRSYNATQDKVVEDYDDLSLIEDTNGHGTKVAGVIAASQSLGTCGLVDMPKLLIIKCETNERGEFKTSDLVFALSYAIDEKAAVVNMSFEVELEEGEANPFARYTKLAKDSDILCVASAGNSGTSKEVYPAADTNVIGVGALAQDSWELADYSNYGDNTLIVAPGTVWTTQPYNHDSTAITPRRTAIDGYAQVSGTSYAAAQVSAALCLYDRQYYEHEYNYDTALELLKASARDLGDAGYDGLYGYGCLDINAFLYGEVGTATFDFQTDDIATETRKYIVGKPVVDVPDPDRDGFYLSSWYRDDLLEDEVDPSSEAVLDSSATFYAAWEAEDEASAWSFRDVAGGVEVAGYTGKRKSVAIPETYEGKTVVGIGDGAFADSARMVICSIPDSVTYIGNNAFSGCKKLTSVSVPDSVTTLGESAFRGCSVLSRVTIAETSRLQTVGQWCFAECAKLLSLNLPAAAASIDGTAMYGCVSLRTVTVAAGNASFKVGNSALMSADGKRLVLYPARLSGSVSIPEGVSEIGAYAFAYSGITSVSMPSTLTSLGSNAFKASSRLRFLDLSGTALTSVSASAFQSCAGLSEVTLPDCMQEIGDRAFSDSGLKTCIIGESSALSGIGSEAFKGTSLESIALPASLQSIGDSAFYGTMLASVSIPANVSSIGEGAFENARLTNLEFTGGSNLKTISSSAFSGNLLQTVQIPDSVTEIQSGAFASNLLTEVTIGTSVTSIASNAFCSNSSLEAYTVESGNAGGYYATDGVLFRTADGVNELVAFPTGKGGSAGYSVPEGVGRISAWAFQGTKIWGISIPSSVTEICEGAFLNSSSLGSQEVQLSEGLITIAPNAFEGCKNLKSLSIPASVASIGRYAFYRDSSLSNITFAEGSQLKRIGNATFASCGLSSFEVPASVTSIGQQAFASCSGLISISFADGSHLRNLPAWVFEECDALASISFGQGAALESLNARCLEYLPSLVTLDLSGTSVSAIGNYALIGCNALSAVSLPESLQSIGRYAFFGCQRLAQMNLPSGLASISRYAFSSCNGQDGVTLLFGAASLPSSLEENWNYGVGSYYLGSSSISSSADGLWSYVDLTDGTIALYGYSGSASDLVIGEIDGKKVSMIGYGLFRGNATLQSATLPDTVTSIADYAFAETPALQSVNIPDAVMRIGSHAFDSSAISTVSVSDSSRLSELDSWAFYNTAQLASFNVPAGVKSIPYSAFRNSGIQTITFVEGSSLESVGRYAFAKAGLTSLSLPSTVTEVGSYAFYENKAMASLDLGGSALLKVRDNAFYGCGFSSFEVPAGLYYIGEYAFDSCVQLQSVSVAAGNNYFAVQDGALYNAAKDRLIVYPTARAGSVTIPSGIRSIAPGAFENAKLTALSFESGSQLQAISYRAFYQCENLATVSLPESLKVVSGYAFSGCSALTQLTIPAKSGLSAVSTGAFRDCTALGTISLPASLSEIGNHAFYGCKMLDVNWSDASSLLDVEEAAFAYTSVSSFDAPASLRTVGDEAFRYCNLTSLNLDSDDLVSIGAYAFADSPSLVVKDLTIGTNVEEIGRSALGGVTGVESITLPIPASTGSSDVFNLEFLFGNRDCLSSIKSVEVTKAAEIPEQCFYRCNQLAGATLPEGLWSIGKYAFSGCSLTSIDIPDSVTDIGYASFSNNSSLATVKLPANLWTIGHYAFSRCSSLESVDLPNGLKEIGCGAFSGTAISSISFPEGLVSVGTGAFSNLEGTVTLPASLQSVYQGMMLDGTLFEDSPMVGADGSGSTDLTYDAASAFVWCTGITRIEVAEGSESFCVVDGALYSKDKRYLIWVPNSYEGELKMADETVQVLAYAAKGRAGLSNVVPSAHLEKIGERAFADTSITSIDLPEGMTAIGRKAFENASIDHMYLPGSLLMSDMTGCNVKSVEFGKGTTTIPTFTKNTVLESIVIPSGVTMILGSAFEGCTSLKDVQLPDTLTEIKYSAFEDCTALETIELPSSLTIIGYNAFEKSGLTEINIPASVCALEANESFDLQFGRYGELSNPFNGCSNLSKITVDEGNEHYIAVDNALYSADGTRLYCGCLGQTGKVAVRTGVTHLISKAFAGSQASEIVLPNTVAAIPMRFASGSSLEAVYLPNSILSIDQYAFENCGNLKYVSIPDSVTSIGDAAFGYCSNLHASGILLGKGIESMSHWSFLGSPCINDDSGYISGYLLRETFDVNKCMVVRDGSVGVFADVVFATLFSFPDSLLHLKMEINSQATAINLPSGLETLNLKSSYITSLDLPSSLKSITLNCPNVKWLSLPDGVEKIGNIAFGGSRIDIPASATSVGGISNGGTYYDCCALREITYASGANPEKYAGIYRDFNGGTTEQSTERLIVSWDMAVGENNILQIGNLVKGAHMGSYTGVYPIDIVVRDSAKKASSASVVSSNSTINLSGAKIYLYGDSAMDYGPEGWWGDNTVYTNEQWDLTTFKVNGITMSCYPLLRGNVVSAPSAQEIAEVAPGLVFKGWDVDGDGEADTLPTTLIDDMTAVAVLDEHDWQETVIAAPTCDAAGESTFTCSLCGATETRTTEALGHEWSEWTTIVEPTYEAAGYQTRKCLRCGTETSSTLPKLEVVDPVSVSLPTGLKLAEGDVSTLKAVLAPASASANNIAWTTSNPDVATVDAGVVAGVSAGTCKVTATLPNGKSSSCSVMVTQAGDNPYASLPSSVLYGRSLLLKGSIGMNVYMAIPDEVRAVDGAYVQITDASDKVLSTIPLSDAVQNGSYNSVPLYGFAGYVAAKDMTQGLTYRIYSGDGWPLSLVRSDTEKDIVAEGYTCTVEGYYSAVSSSSSSVVPLLNAMLLYGSRCQTLFGTAGDSLATDNIDASTLSAFEAEANAVTADSLDDYATSYEVSDDVGCYGASLTLKSSTYINVYFQLKQGEVSDYDFLIDDVEVEPVKNGGYWCLTKTDITAANLDETYVFKVVRKSDNAICSSVSYSALSYVRTILNNPSSSNALVDTVRALRVYNTYANKYFDASESN